MFTAIRRHNLLICIVLSGFILFTAKNTASYGHIHTLAEGSVVYHIHPFQKTDSTPKHSHTKADFEFLSISSLSQFTENNTSIEIILYPKITHLDRVSDASQLNTSELCFSKNGRSPPASVEILNFF